MFQFHLGRTRTYRNPNPRFTELETNPNLISPKYSEPEQDRTLIIKELEQISNAKFGVLSHL